MFDDADKLQAQILAAAEQSRPLQIAGNNTKAFLGRTVEAQLLSTKHHQGIVSYEPTELVITARSGTSLEDIENTLALENQMLGCEPPHFGPQATFGGMVAAGLSGPARPFYGAVRDFVLGCKLINGHAEILQFGGQVMKNVAGYDLSRLMAGSLGCLGVLLEISLKVLPKPQSSRTICREMSLPQALDTLTTLNGQWLPLTAAAYYQRSLYLRFAGNEKVVNKMCDEFSGETTQESFWHKLKEQELDFFLDKTPLWRLSLPSATPMLDIEGDCLLDWSGGLRWLKSDACAEEIFAKAKQAGGHATLFKSADNTRDVYSPLDPTMMKLHQNLKRAMDPERIFNPGRLYKEL